MNGRISIVAGCVAMFVAVAAGAFGAHALRARLAPDMLAIWHTAVEYQAWHALALLFTGFLLAQRTVPRAMAAARSAAWLFIVGIMLFSGSLYLLVLSGQRWLGAITPLGGVAWLAGWAVLAVAVWRQPRG